MGVAFNNFLHLLDFWVWLFVKIRLSVTLCSIFGFMRIIFRNFFPYLGNSSDPYPQGSKSIVFILYRPSVNGDSVLTANQCDRVVCLSFNGKLNRLFCKKWFLFSGSYCTVVTKDVL